MMRLSLEECAAHCDNSPGCFAFSWGVPTGARSGQCYLVTNAIGAICTDLSLCDEGGCYADASEGSAIIESCEEFNLESSDDLYDCYCRTAGPSN